MSGGITTQLCGMEHAKELEKQIQRIEEIEKYAKWLEEVKTKSKQKSLSKSQVDAARLAWENAKIPDVASIIKVNYHLTELEKDIDIFQKLFTYAKEGDLQNMQFYRASDVLVGLSPEYLTQILNLAKSRQAVSKGQSATKQSIETYTGNNKGEYQTQFSVLQQRLAKIDTATKEAMTGAMLDNDTWRMASLATENTVKVQFKHEGYTATPLLIATKQKKHYEELSELQDILDAGADPNVKDSNGNTPLLLMISHGDKNLLQALLEHGANPNATNNNGETVLGNVLTSRANTSLSKLETCKLLLEKDANPNKLTNVKTAGGSRSITPLSLAIIAEASSPKVVERLVLLLLNAGAEPNSTEDINGDTPLHTAARRGSLAAVQALLATCDPEKYKALLETWPDSSIEVANIAWKFTTPVDPSIRNNVKTVRIGDKLLGQTAADVGSDKEIKDLIQAAIKASDIAEKTYREANPSTPRRKSSVSRPRTPSVNPAATQTRVSVGRKRTLSGENAAKR